MKGSPWRRDVVQVCYCDGFASPLLSTCTAARLFDNVPGANVKKANIEIGLRQGFGGAITAVEQHPIRSTPTASSPVTRGRYVIHLSSTLRQKMQDPAVFWVADCNVYSKYHNQSSYYTVNKVQLGKMMVLNRQRGTVALLLLLAAACEAFTTIVVPPSVGRHQSVTTTAPARREFFASSWTRLQLSSEDSESNEEGGSNPDPAASAVDDDEVDEENEPAEEDEEEKEEQEDPELKALKEEIAQLEQDLKNARRKVADVSDRADDFTKTGYARRVAEMENMRRARSVRAVLLCCCGLVAMA